MFYQFYEFNHAAVQPLRAVADATRLFYSNPMNPMSISPLGRSISASAEVFERVTRRYSKPEFGIKSTVINGEEVSISEEVVWKQSFCNLLHFKRGVETKDARKILIVAPMSGHYATLLRGTVEAMLPHGDVYITDWIDARQVPITDGRFDLDDYIDYVIEMMRFLGEGCTVMAVCQPSVPVMAAVALMEARGAKALPSAMILMGGPIDTTRSPTAVNDLAEEKGISWFRQNAVMPIPWPNPGVMREVYPGFLQLTGFMSMNLDRHVGAHKDFFSHLVKNDGESAEKHRDFYDEYLAVMDLTAEFYLQTVETVFIEHHLPKGIMTRRGEPVKPEAIKSVALMTIEGENDDITGGGQTQAAHDLCPNIPDSRKTHYTQPEVGHYGVFNGSRFRSQIVPRIVEFMENAEKPLTTKTSNKKNA